MFFAFHCLVILVIASMLTPYISGTTMRLFRMLGSPPRQSSFEFLFSHLLATTLCLGLVAGALVTRFDQRAAMWVWLPFAVLLGYRLLTFPSASVLNTTTWPAMKYYFDSHFLIPEWHSYEDLGRIIFTSPDARRSFAQLHSTAYFYAAVGYSIGALFAMQLGFADWLQAQTGRHPEPQPDTEVSIGDRELHSDPDR